MLKGIFMGIKVKCQHCWKTFEVSETFINRQKQCDFCQRMTIVKPIEEKKQAEEIEFDGDVQDISGIAKILGTVCIIMTILTLINLIISFSSGKVDDTLKDAIIQETPEWHTELKKEMDTLGEKLKLPKNQTSQKTADDVVNNVIDTLSGSIRLITEKLLHTKKELIDTNKKLKELEKEIEVLTKALESK